jgi:uncharacterized membrane protein YGL010W
MSKTIENWLSEYSASHRNPLNKRIHFVCVPAIFFSLVGLLYVLPLGFNLVQVPLTAAHVALALILIYYTRLAFSLAIGMAVFGLMCLTACNILSTVGFNLWKLSLIVFAVAWIGQFIGHHFEGKKPSFLKDLQFLLIGPAWIMSFLFRKLGITMV